MKKSTIALFFLLAAAPAFAAVGCDLNDPDRDVARLFPGSTGYKTRYVWVKQAGGRALLEKIERRLGDKFKGLYETMEVPYTLYDIYKDKELVGYIHGVNQKGEYGGIQVFLALDKAGTVKAFYIQKLTSRAAKDLRSETFGSQFEGLSLKDFESYRPGKTVSAALKIEAPAKAGKDFGAVLRAVKKNLILLDEFVFSEKKK
jgi:hypothetical protein